MASGKLLLANEQLTDRYISHCLLTAVISSMVLHHYKRPFIQCMYLTTSVSYCVSVPILGNKDAVNTTDNVFSQWASGLILRSKMYVSSVSGRGKKSHSL